MSSMVEQVGDDIRAAIVGNADFSTGNGWTVFQVDKDEDEDVDVEYDVPNVIYGAESTPTEYFMDSTRLMTAMFTFVVNISEFTTDGSGLTKKRLVNYKLDQHQDVLNDMTFSSVIPTEFNTNAGETAARIPINEDDFLYRGTVQMSVQFLDETT